MTQSELRAKWPALSSVMIEHGPGWYGVLDQMLTSMQKAGFDQRTDRITQVKEKFGTIRVYFALNQSIERGVQRMEPIRKAMHEADKSARTCETCGQASRLMVSNGLVMSRCLVHKPSGAKTLREHFNPSG